MPGNSVVPGQPLVDERVVGVEQLDDAAIVAERARHEELGFALERLQQALVVGRISIRIDDHLGHAAQVQPLRGEAVHEGAGGSRIGQHPPHFPFEDRRTSELFAFGQVEQPLVGHAAPQEERQPRSDLEIAQAVRRPRGRSIAIDAQQEVRVNEHALERQLNAGIEALAVPSSAIEEVEQSIQVRLRHRPAIRATRHLRQDGRRAGALIGLAIAAHRRRSRAGSACHVPGQRSCTVLRSGPLRHSRSPYRRCRWRSSVRAAVGVEGLPVPTTRARRRRRRREGRQSAVMRTSSPASPVSCMYVSHSGSPAKPGSPSPA